MESSSYRRYLQPGVSIEDVKSVVSEQVVAGESIRDTDVASATQLRQLFRRANDWANEVRNLLTSIFGEDSQLGWEFVHVDDRSAGWMQQQGMNGFTNVEYSEESVDNIQRFAGGRVVFLKGLLTNLRFAPDAESVISPEVSISGSDQIELLEKAEVRELNSGRASLLGGGPFSAALRGLRSETFLTAVDTDEVDASRDYLSASRESDAIAFLMSSRALNTPLSFGIFGEWGSGKSFYLRRMKRVVENNTILARRLPADVTPVIHKRIAQVEFNAWHYAESNLWASLTSHLFSQLGNSQSGDGVDIEGANTRILHSIEQVENQNAEWHAEEDRLIEKRRHAESEINALIKDRDAKLASMRSPDTLSVLKGVVLSSENKAKLRAELSNLGLDQTITSGEDAIAAIKDARNQLQSGPLSRLLPRGRSWTAGVVASICVVPLVSFLLGAVDVSSVVNAIVSVTPGLAGLAILLRKGATVVATASSSLEKFEGEIEARVGAKQAELQAEITQQQAAIDELSLNIEAARANSKSAQAELEKLSDSLQRLTPSRVLDEFLADRSSSDEYATLLGMPASVARDMNRLSKLIEKNNSSEEDRPDGLNRVILYIDDLDRCLPSRVVEVLHAIYMLTSFKNVVVVVAVDVAWLASSLESYYPNLRSSDSSVAYEYLEKIFQIPVWTASVGDRSKIEFMHYLLQPREVSSSQGSTASAGSESETAGSGARQDEPVVASKPLLLEATAVASRDNPASSQYIDFSAKELRDIDSIASWLRGSPRAIKRYLNTLRILKMVLGGRDSRDIDEFPEVIRAATLLLAIATNPASIGFLREIVSQCSQDENSNRSVNDLSASLADDTDGWARLRDWLSSEGWSLSVAHVADVAPWVLRHTFRGEVG